MNHEPNFSMNWNPDRERECCLEDNNRFFEKYPSHATIVTFVSLAITLICSIGPYLSIALGLIRAKVKSTFYSFSVFSLFDSWILISSIAIHCQLMANYCRFEMYLPPPITQQFICQCSLAMSHLALYSILLTVPLSVAYQVPSFGRVVWPKVAYGLKFLGAIILTVITVSFEDLQLAERPEEEGNCKSTQHLYNDDDQMAKMRLRTCFKRPNWTAFITWVLLAVVVIVVLVIICYLVWLHFHSDDTNRPDPNPAENIGMVEMGNLSGRQVGQNGGQQQGGEVETEESPLIWWMVLVMLLGYGIVIGLLIYAGEPKVDLHENIGRLVIFFVCNVLLCLLPYLSIWMSRDWPEIATSMKQSIFALPPDFEQQLQAALATSLSSPSASTSTSTRTSFSSPDDGTLASGSNSVGTSARRQSTEAPGQQMPSNAAVQKTKTRKRRQSRSSGH